MGELEKQPHMVSSPKRSSSSGRTSLIWIRLLHELGSHFCLQVDAVALDATIDACILSGHVTSITLSLYECLGHGVALELQGNKNEQDQLHFKCHRDLMGEL